MRIFNFFLIFVKLMAEKYQDVRISGKCTFCRRVLVNPVHEGHRVFLANGNFKKNFRKVFFKDFWQFLFYSFARSDKITLVPAHHGKLRNLVRFVAVIGSDLPRNFPKSGFRHGRLCFSLKSTISEEIDSEFFAHVFNLSFTDGIFPDMM